MKLRFGIVVALLLSTLSAASAQVRVWQSTLTLPTYEEGPPDPNPPFDQYANGRFNYPYTLRHNLTTHRVDHVWRAVFLENEYLKCSVLPDIGGHLYSCTDKISGQPMFYENPSIKKADIGYRGAWAAFGVEFNFPVSHNWVTASPVDFVFGQRQDGSAYVQVGDIDRVYGMQWSVELVLHPRSTLLEERVALNNRSDVRHRFYWWNNAGIQVWDDTRIEYPMRFTASHGFTDIEPWPIGADGNDLSIVKNHTKGPVSRFAYGSREPFMGVWHPHTNTGVVHYSDYAELPAKKIWSWGSDPDGLDWRKALSDNNSAYVEVQAGLFRNQETYAFLEPRQTISFSEYWMPAREIGGISRANLAGVVHLSRQQNVLRAALNVNQALPAATLRILAGDREVFREKADLSPPHTWSHQIENAESQQSYTFELHDAKGSILLRQTEQEYDWTPADQVRVGSQPAYRVPDSEHRTADDWLQLGNQQELDGQLLIALQTYKDAIARFPESFDLQKAAGRLCVSLLRMEEAEAYLRPVHERNTTDAEASYYLGIANEGLGQSRKARESYEAAARLPAFRATAGLRLAELSAREGDLKEAELYLRSVMRSAPDDPRAAEELSAVLSAEGQNAESRALANTWLDRVPERYFLLEQVGEPDLHQLGNDAERVLNIAEEYMRLGMYTQALVVLSRKYPDALPDESEPHVLSANKHPMVAYYRAYCRGKLGQSVSTDLSAAQHLPTTYIFPSRATDVGVLRAGLLANPEDGTAHYLLGTFYFARGLSEPALAEWQQARRINPHIPVLHASLGRALLHTKDDPRLALSIFEEGLGSDPKNQELYTGMDQALSILQRAPNERVRALEQYPDRANMPTKLVSELILNLAEAGEFDNAVALFHDRFFPREEGGTNVRQIWLEVQVQRAMSSATSERCSEAANIVDNLSEPVASLVFTRDGLEPYLRSARFSYLIGRIYKKCGLMEKANQAFARSAGQSGLESSVWSVKAAEELSNFDHNVALEKLHVILNRFKDTAEEGDQTSWWLYNIGMVETALGDREQAEKKFRQALLAPDRLMAYHLTRLALCGNLE